MTEIEKELKETKKELKELKRDIKNVLLKYFQYRDNGKRSRKYLSYYAPQDAVDDIHSIIGDI